MVNTFKEFNEEVANYHLKVTEEEEYSGISDTLGEDYMISRMLKDYNEIYNQLYDAGLRYRMNVLRTTIDILKSKRMVGSSYKIGRMNLNGKTISAVYKITGYDSSGDFYGTLVGYDNGTKDSYYIITNFHVSCSTPFIASLKDEEFKKYLNEATSVLNEHVE